MVGTLDYGYLSISTGILNIAEIVCLILYFINAYDFKKVDRPCSTYHILVEI